MSSDNTLKRVTRPNAFRGSRGTRPPHRDTGVYVEDGWIFRMKPGAPIECVRETNRADMLSPVETLYGLTSD